MLRGLGDSRVNRLTKLLHGWRPKPYISSAFTWSKALISWNRRWKFPWMEGEARGTCPRYQLNMHDLGYKKPFITATVSRIRIETTQATFAETSKGRQSIVHESYNYQKIRQNGEQSLCTPIKENFNLRVVKWLQPLGNTSTPQARHKLLPTLSSHLWKKTAWEESVHLP